MSYRNPAAGRAYDKKRWQEFKARGAQPVEYPENPLARDEWIVLQKAAYLQGMGVWMLVRKLADLWPDVPLAN